jgi:hypothetical protein
VRALLIVLATILLAGGILSVASSPPPSQDEVDARERTRPIDARPRRDHERSEAVARPQGAAVARDDARAPVRHERARPRPGLLPATARHPRPKHRLCSIASAAATTSCSCCSGT